MFALVVCYEVLFCCDARTVHKRPPEVPDLRGGCGVALICVDATLCHEQIRCIEGLDLRGGDGGAEVPDETDRSHAHSCLHQCAGYTRWDTWCPHWL